MKIKSLKFIQHPVFNNHTVFFDHGSIINFLVGNNGSGKTHVLEAIFNITNPHGSNIDKYEIEFNVLISDSEKTKYNVIESEVLFKLIKTGSGHGHNFTTLSGVRIDNESLASIAKIVFSTIEVNFGEHSISSVTSKNIDEVISGDKPYNISSEIPQLLIDISALDDADRGMWVSQHEGQIIEIPSDIGVRIKRFTSAFNKIYDGQKTFSGIKNIEGAKHIIFLDNQGREISLNKLSTGEKQIIYRIGYILKNLGNVNGGIILIDEPEISLHPIWQIKLKEFLIELFNGYDVQLFIATHSPYIFKNLDETKEVCIKVDRTNLESKKISMIFPNVPYNPSVLLIGYLAYGIADEMLHVELYTLLQIRHNKPNITGLNGIEDWLQDSAGGNMPIKQTFTRSNRQVNETIMTWIRNKIHHGDEPARPVFTQTDLKDSIDEMIRLLKMP